MEKVTDEHCEKIFKILEMNYEKIRFNKLFQLLPKYGAKMSRPTLIEHLNHLVKNEFILRHEEGKQKVSYEINWEKFKQIAKDLKKINEISLIREKDEKKFKSISMDQQVLYNTAFQTIGELLKLKLSILDTVNPENKLQNQYSYIIIRRQLNIYNTWLLDSCKESEDNTKKALKSIEKVIQLLTEIFLEKPPDQNTQETQQKEQKT